MIALLFSFNTERITIMKYGFIRKFCCLPRFHTLVQELRPHSLVFVVPFWNAFFGTHFLERSAERALNPGIAGAFWDTFGSNL